MARYLVTGASGFIGTHLVRALAERGHDVACLVRRTSRLASLEGLPVQFVSGDIADPASLKTAVAECDVIVHLAGLTKALCYQDMLRVNATGMQHLMEAAASLPTPPVVVFVSSLAAAGPAIDGRPKSPEDPAQPVSNYGKSKLVGEQAAMAFADRVPLSIVRPPIVIGEGDLLALGLFQTVATFRLHLVPGLKPSRFSIVHVTDLVAGIIAVAERGRRVQPKPQVPIEATNGDGLAKGAQGQGIYYLADDEAPDFAEFGRMIARGLGRRVLCLPTPRVGVRISGLLGELAGQLCRRPMSLNLDKAREAVAGNWICSPQSAHDDLGWQTAAPLTDRIRQTAQWYLREGWV